MLSSASFARVTVFFLAASILYFVPMESALSEPIVPAKAAPRVHTVQIKGMAFVPATLNVSVGDTIVWVNDDLVPHTATGIVDDVKVFDSGELAAKASWKYVASKPGTIPMLPACCIRR